MMDIIRAFHDKNLLGAGIRDFSTFAAWEVALRAIFGLGFVDDNQRPIYQRCTHRTDDPAPCREAVLLCGRRSGKSFMMGLIAVFLALFRFGGKKPYLQRREVLTIKVIAQDRDAARTIMGYVDGLLSVPLFIASTPDTASLDEPPAIFLRMQSTWPDLKGASCGG